MLPLIVLAVVSALMTLLLGLWARSIAPDPRQVPIIASEARALYLVGILAAAIVGGATTWLLRTQRDHEPDSEWTEHYTASKQIETSWILPAMTILGAFLLVARYHRGQDIAAAVLLAGSGVFAGLTVRDSLTVRDPRFFSSTRLALSTLTVGIAFVVFALVLLYRTRTLYAGPVVFGVGFLLLLQAQDGIPSLPMRRIAFAAIGAVALAQATWALSTWPPSGWWSGGALAAILLGYCLVSGAQLADALTRELALRSIGVAAAMFALCVFMAR